MPNYGPFAPAQINFSPLTSIGEDIGGLIKQRRDQEIIRQAMQKGDYSTAVQTLLQAGDAANAAKVAKIQEMQQGGQERFSLTPQFDQEGNAYFPGSRGSLHRSGVQLQEPRVYVQTPQAVEERGRFGGSYGTTNKDYSLPAQQKEFGQVTGGAQATIPDITLNVNTALQAIDKAISDPGRETATGVSGSLDPRNYVPGTEATSYREGTLAQVKGTSFLSGIQQMHGLGQMSDAEGRAATAAQTALNTQQTDEAHLRSLYELKALNLRGLLRTYQKAGQDAPQEVVDAWAEAERVSGLQRKVPFKALPGDGGPASPMSGPAAQGSALPDPGNESVYPEVGPRPSQNDMMMLQKYQADPSFRAEFEKIYGAGSVDRWLNNDGWTGR